MPTRLPEIDLPDAASLPEGALKAFTSPHGGPQVLLTRPQGQVPAFAPNCPRYGAPPEKGKIVGGKLICPRHRACREGFAGPVILASADAEASYDRTKLRKAYLASKAQPAALPLREQYFYQAQPIELWLSATGLDLARQEISSETHPSLRYDQLLLALGSTPNRLPKLPGHHRGGVYTPRTQPDANALLAAAKEAR